MCEGVSVGATQSKMERTVALNLLLWLRSIESEEQETQSGWGGAEESMCRRDTHTRTKKIYISTEGANILLLYRMSIGLVAKRSLFSMVEVGSFQTYSGNNGLRSIHTFPQSVHRPGVEEECQEALCSEIYARTLRNAKCAK